MGKKRKKKKKNETGEVYLFLLDRYTRVVHDRDTFFEVLEIWKFSIEIGCKTVHCCESFNWFLISIVHGAD